MAEYTTKDTGEVVHHTAPHPTSDDNGYSLDGYDWMDAAATTNWHSPGLWGKDGWDCGQWPYVILALAKGTDEAGNFYGMTTYCEGDLSTTFYRDQMEQWAAITKWCYWNWTHGQGNGPKDLPGKLEDLGSECWRPYGDEYDGKVSADGA